MKLLLVVTLTLLALGVDAFSFTHIFTSKPSSIKLKISARNLKDKDSVGIGSAAVPGTSDPYVKVYYRDDTSKSESYLGDTPHQMDTPNPEFNKIFDISYDTTKNPKLVLYFIDWDPLSNDEIGKAVVDLNAFAMSTGDFTVPLDTQGTAILKKVN